MASVGIPEFWRGNIQRQVDEHERRLNAINGSIDGLRKDINERLEEYEERQTRLLVKLGIACGVCGFFAAPAIGGLVYVLTQAAGGG
jgi:hypothetical protein